MPIEPQEAHINTDVLYQPQRAIVLLCASGRGRRLWPLSTFERPKSFAYLLHPQKSLLMQLVESLPAYCRTPGHLYVAVTADLRHWAMRQLRELSAESFLEIPGDKDTLGTIAYASCQLAQRHPDATLIPMASDIHFADANALQTALANLIKAAQSGPHLAMLGIPPRYPSPHFGYIVHSSRATAMAKNCFWADQYLERPSAQKAQQLIQTGRSLWGTGVFAFDIKHFFAALAAVDAPLAVLVDQLRQALASADPALLAQHFAQLPATSIEFALLEKLSRSKHSKANLTHRMVVVSSDMPWLKINHFHQIVPHLKPMDHHGNRLRGNVHLDNCQHCCLLAEPPYRLEAKGLRHAWVCVNENGDTLVSHIDLVDWIPQLLDLPLQTYVFHLGQAPRQPLTAWQRSLDVHALSVHASDEALTGVIGIEHCTVERHDQVVRVSSQTDHTHWQLAAQAKPATPIVATPQPKSVVLVWKNSEVLARAVAKQLLSDIHWALSQHLYPNLVLSTSPSLVRVYDYLLNFYQPSIVFSRLRIWLLPSNEKAAQTTSSLLKSLAPKRKYQLHALEDFQQSSDLAALENQLKPNGGISVALCELGDDGGLINKSPLAPFIQPLLGKAGRLRVVAFGQHKQPIVEQCLLGPFNSSLPLLQLGRHRDVLLFLDTEAARCLRSKPQQH